MGSLDEVIRAIEECRDSYVAGKIIKSDALHYLKEYQERLHNLQDMMDRYDISVKNYEEAVENCRIAEQKYWRMTNNVEDMSPLTWDELKQMVGKPVWIDSVPLIRRWVIIKKFHPIGRNKNLFDMEVEDGAHFLRKSMRRDAPAWWQAYRKERE